MTDSRFLNPQFDARDARRRLAIECRAAGIRGVAPLARNAVTAHGKATRSVNLDATGMQPSANPHYANLLDAGMFDVSRSARYTGEGYKGAEFADSAFRARLALGPVYPNGCDMGPRLFSVAPIIPHTWIRDVFPWMPTDKNGKLLTGKVDPKSGERVFKVGFDTFTASYLYNAYATREGADKVAERKSREAMLAELRDEQDAEMAYDRKHSRRTRMIGR